MDIFEDERVVSRTDLAAWLRQLAGQLESGGKIFFGAAGTVTVADQVRCELEIEQESDSEISMEIEFTWVDPTAAGTVAAEEAEAGEEEEEEEEAAAEEEPAEGVAEEAGGEEATEETTMETHPPTGSVV
ncbi:MAG TPA: amphi-Trp domain-containing protein [Micromonospora sp.]|nr:amphi-Trp domain-containing protein [Micromonospora sp.]